MKVRIKPHTKRLAIKLQIFAMMGLFLSSCGLAGSSGTSCDSGTAQIHVYDAYIRRVCGCTEPGNQIFGPGQSLQCTVSVGTQMYVSFINIQVPHQIAVNTIGTRPYFSPSTSATVQSDVILLNSTGTFNFVDTQVTTLSGSFIVN